MSDTVFQCHRTLQWDDCGCDFVEEWMVVGGLNVEIIKGKAGGVGIFRHPGIKMSKES